MAGATFIHVILQSRKAEIHHAPSPKKTTAGFINPGSCLTNFHSNYNTYIYIYIHICIYVYVYIYICIYIYEKSPREFPQLQKWFSALLHFPPTCGKKHLLIESRLAGIVRSSCSSSSSSTSIASMEFSRLSERQGRREKPLLKMVALEALQSHKMGSQNFTCPRQIS